MHRSSLGLAALLAGCGGAEATLSIDAALIDQRIDEVAEAVPLCDATGSSTPEARAARAIYSVVRALPELAGPRTPISGTGSTGSCGGTLDVAYDHADGDTSYTALFSAFCMSSADGDVVVDGTVSAVEDGTPSDYGPIISSLSIDTDGPVEIVAAGERITVELSDTKTTYGIPDTWMPGIPDEASPDVTEVGEARVTFEGPGTEYWVEDLTAERVGPYPTNIHVTEGVLGAAEGTVLVSTLPDDPLVISLSGLVEDGALVLTGKGDTTATLVPDPTQPGVASFTVNGEAHSRGLDCSSGVGVYTEAVTALVLALLPGQ